MSQPGVTLRPEAAWRPAVERSLATLQRRLQAIWPELTVEHVGSTAVPGALTKGDLDLMLSVPEGEFGQVRRALDEAFGRNPEMPASEDFVSYAGHTDGVDFGLQLVVAGETEFAFVRWRDALRGSPELLAQYNALKQRMRGGSMEDYRQAKSDLIEGYLQSPADGAS